MPIHEITNAIDIVQHTNLQISINNSPKFVLCLWFATYNLSWDTKEEYNTGLSQNPSLHILNLVREYKKK